MIDRTTQRALALGVVALALASFLYVEAGVDNRPLAVFAVPVLLVALVGGWRSTVAVGVVSLVVAAALAEAGHMNTTGIWYRMVVNVIITTSATIVAYLRERQQAQLVQLAEASSLYHVFEAGLLPSPTVPSGYDVALRFVSSDQQMTLGGDLVDAVDLPDGRLAIVIGDVCGHGPREAAFATAVRAGWRTVVRTHRPDPSAWLSHLRRTLFADDTGLPYVTMCTGIVDEATGEITLAIAGHPPPIAIGPSAGPIVLQHGAPLGVDPLTRWPNQRIAVGDGLLFYTDGLVDNPAASGPADRWGESGLVKWIRAWSAEHSVPSDPDQRREFVTALVDEARRGRVITDDLAAMVVAVDRRGRHPSRSTATSRGSGQHELVDVHHAAQANQP